MPLWRDGRVVECGGLENRCTARYRGFESLSLRFKRRKLLFSALFFCLLPQLFDLIRYIILGSHIGIKSKSCGNVKKQIGLRINFA